MKFKLLINCGLFPYTINMWKLLGTEIIISSDSIHEIPHLTKNKRNKRKLCKCDVIISHRNTCIFCHGKITKNVLKRLRSLKPHHIESIYRQESYNAFMTELPRNVGFVRLV